MSEFQFRTKNFVSISIAFILLIMLLPLMILISLIIKITSKGPILFSQKRVGINGKIFNIYKFRTMIIDAEKLKHKLMKHNEADGPVFKIKNDPRMTKFGKFLRKTGLDELPQFFNILMGDMDIVGPRPPLESEVVKYEDWQMKRLSVKPGVTCLWQVSPNRHKISFDEWVKMDLDYINNWSFKLEFMLMFKTIFVLIRSDGQ